MSAVLKVAVVGAGGFLGTAIERVLVGAGHAVEAYDLDRPFAENGRLDHGSSEAKCVIWAAATVNPVIAAGHPERIESDHASFRSALGAIGRDAPQASVLFLSSGGTVYGPPSTPPYVESEPLRPVNAYGEAKAAAESLLRESGVPNCSIRVSNAYGPGQKVVPGQGVIAHWLDAIKRGEPVHVFGDLATSRDYVFVDDIASAVAAAVTAPSLPTALNVGSGRPASLSEVLALVLEVTGAHPESVIHEAARAVDTARTWLAVDAARESLGWAPQVSLRDGISAAWDEILRRP